MGKTYLIDALLGLFKEDSNSYEFLQIDLLSFDLDKIEDVIINGVEDILYKNGIYSSVGRRIRKLLGKTSWAEPFLSLFCDTTSSLADAYDELVDKVTHLNKTIVIVVEDIDRLIVSDSNKKAIDLIFGIAEKLTTHSSRIPTNDTNGRIKIIFQYDFNMLKEQFNFINRNYLEKYIPHEINLTPVPYEIVARKLLQEPRLFIGEIIKHTTNGKISSNDIALIDYGLDSQTIARFALEVSEVTINNPFSKAYSIRVVERYLDELRFTYQRLQNDLWITNIEQSKYYSSIKGCYMLIARILYVKHFYPELYDQLQEGTSPYESWKVKWKDSRVTVKEMLQLSVKYGNDSRDDRDKYLSELQNNATWHARIWILLFLGYRLDAFCAWSKKFDLSWDDLNEDIPQEINKKNDRIIWHMLWCGESANTDNEILVSLVKKKVLDVKSEEQAEAWKKLCLDVQSGTLRNGTRPLYFSDLKSFYPVFYASYIVETNEAYWQALIDFYTFHCKELFSKDVKYCNIYFKNLELIFKSVSSASTLMKVMASFTENCSAFSIETIENNSYAKFLQLAMKFIKEKYLISHKWSKEEEWYDFQFFRTHSPMIDSTVKSLLTSIKKYLSEQIPEEELNIVEQFITENITVIDKILEFYSRSL